MAPPINPPNHPPTHQTIHPPIGGGVSTDFKSSNRIKISRFIQVLLNFYWFRGHPGGGGGEWWIKWGFGDDVGMTGTMWGWQRWHGDDRDNMGKTGKTGKTPSIDPPINPPIHPTTPPPTKGSGVSANHKSSNRIELSQLGQDLFDFFNDLTWVHPLTHPTTHPPDHSPLIGGGVSTDFKSSNGIKISWFVQVLLNFYWFWGSPRWEWG